MAQKAAYAQQAAQLEAQRRALRAQEQAARQAEAERAQACLGSWALYFFERIWVARSISFCSSVLFITRSPLELEGGFVMQFCSFAKCTILFEFHRGRRASCRACSGRQ